MKKIIVNKENLNGVEVDMTTQEITQRETDNINFETQNEKIQTDIQAKENLKASAKAKLVAGEALTQEEANTIVL